MYIDLRVNLELDATREIEWYIKSKLPDLINEKLFEDPKFIDKLIEKAVEGQFKRVINEEVQSNDYRKYIRDKVLEKLKGEENVTRTIENNGD